MFPYIQINDDYSIALYAPVFLIGFLIAVLIARRLGPAYGVQKDDAVYASFYGVIGLLIGAKFFYLLSKLPSIITHFSTFLELIKLSPLDALNYALGGLVFYGGLIGGVFGAYCYCKQFKVDFIPFLNVFAPLIPLMHGFGRIGCFLAGCCYGIEYHGFLSVQFPYNEIVPELSEVPRFPVQLVEASLNFLVFLILLYLLKKKDMKQGQLMGIYLLYYTVARYLLEFLRGDRIRGGVGIFSTSQLISILLLPVGIILVRGKWMSNWKNSNRKNSHKKKTVNT